MRQSIFLCLLFCLLSVCASSSWAQEVGQPLFLDVAQKEIDVTTGFSGADITVFGNIAVAGDLALVLTGPEKRIVIRKKEEIAGMWVNRKAMDFKRVPLFYDYAVSRNESLLAGAETLKELKIGLNYISFEPDIKDEMNDVSEFQEAIIRTEQERGNFSLDPKPITFIGPQLFRANFSMPPNVPIGVYNVRAVLFQNGSVIATQDVPITIRPKGLASLILMYATKYSFFYALVGLSMAIIAGLSGFYMLRRDR